MLLKGVVEVEKVQKFDKGKILRDVKVLETFTNGQHDFTWFQIWGENHVDTTVGKSVELEVQMRTEHFTTKDGKSGHKTKLIAVV